MSDRDKLIEFITKCENEILKAHPHITDTARIVATAEYLLTNGVIVPPCKVGDKVYKIEFPFIEEYEVDNILTSFKLVGECAFCHKLCYANFDDIGKTVFLTKEDAEKALKEVE